MTDSEDIALLRANAILHSHMIQAIWATHIKLFKSDPLAFLDSLLGQLEGEAQSINDPLVSKHFRRQSESMIKDLRDHFSEQAAEDLASSSDDPG